MTRLVPYSRRTGRILVVFHMNGGALGNSDVAMWQDTGRRLNQTGLYWSNGSVITLGVDNKHEYPQTEGVIHTGGSF